MQTNTRLYFYIMHTHRCQHIPLLTWKYHFAVLHRHSEMFRYLCMPKKAIQWSIYANWSVCHFFISNLEIYDRFTAVLWQCKMPSVDCIVFWCPKAVRRQAALPALCTQSPGVPTPRPKHQQETLWVVGILLFSSHLCRVSLMPIFFQGILGLGER